MPQIQTKTQPTIRTQPAAGVVQTKTTTPATKTTTLATTREGTLHVLQKNLTDLFKGLYNILTSQSRQLTAAAYYTAGGPVPYTAGGPAPTVVSTAGTKKTLPAGVFEPMAARQFFPSIVPTIAQVEEQLRKKPAPVKQFTPLTPERRQQMLEDIRHAQAVQAARAGSKIMSEVQKTAEAVLRQMEKGLFSATTPAATSAPTFPVEQVAGQIMDLMQSPFAQDIQRLVTFPQPAMQTITNVPPGAEVQIFRDPLGGSTPFFGYVIQPGDTLSKIARNFGVTVEDILKLNKDKTDAIKAVPGRPLGDIIIAGKEIRIPVVQKELKQPPLLGQKFVSADEINQRARENLQQPQPVLDDDKLNQLILERVGIDLSRVAQVIDRLNQLSDPSFYVNRYNQLIEQTGISKDIQALADIRSIMERTKQDVMEEAAKVGGLVTESQVAEVVNFRHGILKAQYQALADAIEAKERLIDNIMKYTAMDRKTIADLLERQLKLEKWKAELAMDAVKWDFNARKELRNSNLKKLENYAESGQLHTTSPDFLYHFVDPESPLYAGITVDELRFYIRMSQEKARQRELDEARKKQLIQKTLEDIQRARSKEAREKELHSLRVRRLQQLIEKGQKNEDILGFDEY